MPSGQLGSEGVGQAFCNPIPLREGFVLHRVKEAIDDALFAIFFGAMRLSQNRPSSPEEEWNSKR